ncbi:glycoside hydrolase superfamily [Myxozyma melibiosi]|uniref:chitinase n=1 Tax=Myxozyma melibiosi TaxID=54550 RepID=A0ABR1F1H2_9ASCO
MRFSTLSTLLSASSLFASAVSAYSSSAIDNVAVYWGQASAGSQDSLATYCESDSVDIVILAFLTTFFGSDDLPEINFANACSDTFSGTTLLQCDQIASDIATCQSKGKKVLLSLGGAVGTYGFTDDSEASDFATTLWNMFGGGDSDYRPFGTSIVDGFDLDIENNEPTGYAAFVTQMRTLYSGGDYYISAAPQCPFPDASIGDALDSAWFDFVFIQFYNNNCGVTNPDNFNYDTDWMTWVTSTSLNSDVRLYVGVPGSSSAAGSGYATPSELQSLMSDISDKSSLGGVMIWDASQAFTNEIDGVEFIDGIKSMLGSLDGSSDSSSSGTTTAASSTSTTAAAVVSTSLTSSEAQNFYVASSATTSSVYVAPTTTSASSTSTAASSTSTTFYSAAPTASSTADESTSTVTVPNPSTLTITNYVTMTVSNSSGASTLSTLTTISTAAVMNLYVNSTSASTATSTTSEVLPSATASTSNCTDLTGTPLAACMNEYYQTVSASDACTLGEVGCIGDLFAQCGYGTWSTFACGTGTVCRALPSGDETSTEFAIACDSEADIAVRFGTSSKKVKRNGLVRRNHRHHGHARHIG